MIDNKIMYEIIEKLHESFSASISICDVSGRVIVSTDSSCMGEMNLLAIEALNINSKVTVSMDSKIQKAGASAFSEKPDWRRGSPGRRFLQLPAG